MAGQERAEHGIALCLSGGGYRAMLFHVGCLWRLNELGWLPRIRHVSSVSAGAITAGALATNWDAMEFDERGVAQRFEDVFVAPVRGLARETIDQWCMLGAAFSRSSAADIVADALDEYLFVGRLLPDIPADQPGRVPRFIFSASNLHSGALFSFSRSRIWDWQLGEIEHLRLRLALVVAAASAFVPMLSPLAVNIEPPDCDPRADVPGQRSASSIARLTDGAVIDPLALEPVWRCSSTLFVCDGGGSVPDAVPKSDWFQPTADVLALMHQQARRVQRSQLLDALAAHENEGTGWLSGAYCGIDGVGNVDFEVSSVIAATEPARFSAMDDSRQEELIHRGYSACDGAVRRWIPAEAATNNAQSPYAAGAAATFPAALPCRVAGAA
jgi:NTE family protein